MEISLALCAYVRSRQTEPRERPDSDDDLDAVLPAPRLPPSMAMFADMRGIDRTVQRLVRPSNALQWLHTVRLGTLPEVDFVRLVGMPLVQFAEFSDKCEGVFDQEEHQRNADPLGKADHLNTRTPVPAKVPPVPALFAR